MKLTPLLRAALLVALTGTTSTLAFAASGQPPLQDMKLWLRADTGVTTNADRTVMAWADQAAGVKHDGVAQGMGIPLLTENSKFVGGPKPVIYFDGTAALVLSNRDDLQVPSISVYVVASVDATVSSGTFLADLRDPYGFSLGVNDTAAGRARWFTGTPNDNMSPTSAALDNGVPYLIEGTFTSAGAKKMFLNGTQVASATGKSMNFATWSALAVGAQGIYPHVGEEETGEPPDLSKFLVGDIAEILVYSTVSDAQRLAVEAYLYQKYFSKPSGAPAIVKQPLSQQVNELGSVTLSVNVDGALPLSCQWLKNGQVLAGADGPFYTISPVSRTDAGPYSVKVSNSLGSATSDEAVLTVIPDTTPPTLLAADRDFLDASQVVIVFSKPVAAASATLASNYSIDHEITVSKAAMGATPDTVLLTTSPVTYGPAYTVTVSAVQDLVGNVIVANSQRRVTVPDPNAPVPTANLKLWLRADVDVKAGADGMVTEWGDRQVGNPAKTGKAVGTPMLTEAAYFSNGPHPVITFDGRSGFNLANVADMRMTNMTFYVVASVAEMNRMRVMIGNYRDVAGWCIGISDNIDGRVKWFTAPPNSMEPDAGQLTEFTPVLLTASYSSVGGEKKLYVNRTLAGSATGVNLSYASNTQLTVGYLEGNRQWFVGDIAEILAYSAVSDSQRSLVEAYLNRKYFGTGTGKVAIILHPASQTVAELGAVTFEVLYEGASPITLQWFRNGTAIPGATSSVYTIPRVSRADNQAQFSVRLQNSFGEVTSSNAVLTVISDTVAPTLVSAKREYLDANQVLVVFSKPLMAGTATQADNYTLNNGVSISQAVMGPNAKTVILTAAQDLTSQGLMLTVKGVQDLVGNTVPADSQVAVAIPASSARPPADNLLCWVAADSGVSADANQVVVDWSDLAKSDAPHNLLSVVGSPKWTLADFFPSGLNPVIAFDGASGIQLANPETMAVPDVSIYVVVSTEEINQSRIFCDLYRDTVGYGLGISDSTPGLVKWFTAPSHSLEPESATLSANVPVLITGTYESSGDKKLYMRTNLVGTAAGVDPIALEEGMELTIGYLQGNRQNLVGTVAEVLVYSSVSDTQRRAVQDYLMQKYFTASSTSRPELRVTRSENNIVITWSGGGVLQSATQINGSWTDLSATSPATFPVTAVPTQFYRVKL
jgi:hypothetical protein